MCVCVCVCVCKQTVYIYIPMRVFACLTGCEVCLSESDPRLISHY